MLIKIHDDLVIIVSRAISDSKIWLDLSKSRLYTYDVIISQIRFALEFYEFQNRGFGLMTECCWMNVSGALGPVEHSNWRQSN